MGGHTEAGGVCLLSLTSPEAQSRYPNGLTSRCRQYPSSAPRDGEIEAPPSGSCPIPAGVRRFPGLATQHHQRLNTKTATPPHQPGRRNWISQAHSSLGGPMRQNPPLFTLAPNPHDAWSRCAILPSIHYVTRPPHRAASESAAGRRPWAPFGVSALQLGDLAARPGKLSTILHTQRERVIASTLLSFLYIVSHFYRPPTCVSGSNKTGKRLESMTRAPMEPDVLVVTPTHHSDCTPTDRNTASRGCFHPPTLACCLCQNTSTMPTRLFGH